MNKKKKNSIANKTDVESLQFTKDIKSKPSGHSRKKTVSGQLQYKENDRSWYLKYNDITPAENINRPMQPRFNKRITKEAALGSVNRFVDVNLDWKGFMNSYMFQQVCNNSYQKIRQDLRSNLPYTVEDLKHYIGNSITLAIMAKQFERDIHWVNYTDPSVTNWMEMYSLIAPNGNYGTTLLETDPRIGNPLSDTDWAHKIALYDLSCTIIRNSLKLPASLKAFVEHYFGSLFVSQTDGYNDQYIRNIMNECDYYIKDSETGEYNLSSINLMSVPVSYFNTLVVEHNTEFGMIIADLNKSGQLEFLGMKDYADWEYRKVYDITYLQALINGYTSDSAATSDHFVRLDRIADAPDEFTQYIFMGGLYKSAIDATIEDDPTRVSPIAIRNMVLKFDSDAELKWPSALTQGVGSDDGLITFDGPFGIMLSSDVKSDTIVKIGLDSGLRFVTPGELNGIKFSDFDEGPDYNLNVDVGTYTSPNFTQPALSGTRQLSFLPLYGTVRELQHVNDNIYDYVVEIFGWAFDLNLTASGSGNIATVYPAVGTTSVRSGFLSLPQSLLQGYGKYWYQLQTNSAMTADTTYTMGSVGTDTTIHLDIRTGTAPINQQGVNFSYRGTKFMTLVNYNINVKFTQSQILINRGSFTRVPVAASSTDVINYISDISPMSNMISASYITYHTSTASDSIAINDGFSALASWFVDQFDYHLPVFTEHRTLVTVTNVNDVVIDGLETSGRVLIKESYAPYYYNILDLIPTVYNMLFSLFETINPKLLSGGKSIDNRHRSKR